jgi:hypothetical protein
MSAQSKNDENLEVTCSGSLRTPLFCAHHVEPDANFHYLTLCPLGQNNGGKFKHPAHRFAHFDPLLYHATKVNSYTTILSHGFQKFFHFLSSQICFRFINFPLSPSLVILGLILISWELFVRRYYLGTDRHKIQKAFIYTLHTLSCVVSDYKTQQ